MSNTSMGEGQNLPAPTVGSFYSQICNFPEESFILSIGKEMKMFLSLITLLLEMFLHICAEGFKIRLINYKDAKTK
jgi:hypothetical protein